MIKEGHFPEDLKNMSKSKMEALACEIREFLIDNVSVTGGHLASNLGVVEITLALHKVFNSPKDKFVWDVGHQAYVHKILTGRADKFSGLRMLDGLSGFPKRSESPHDTFNAGHSSNSISAAYGMAVARDLKGENHKVVAIIGDGALTGGMAFEALNSAGQANDNGQKTNLLVILNDNEMSIGKNIGGMTQYLSNLRSTATYNNFKRGLKKTLKSIPAVGEGIYEVLEHTRDTVKFAVTSGGFFESLGFKYLGPVNGNDLDEMITILEGAKNIDGPVLLHVITKKGKGYKPAELNPGKFHGPGPFDKATGNMLGGGVTPSYSSVFGQSMIELAEKNKNLVAISAAMIDGVGLSQFKEKFPMRIFDAAIAEQHAVDFAAGLAVEGFRPVVAIYSTFLQRAYDQILIDICMQNLPVIFCLDRGGNVGNDGETHHGIYDISYLSHMPNMTVMAPKDGPELKKMMEHALTLSGPVAIRYPRGHAEDFSDFDRNQPLDGKIEILKEGRSDICLLALGKMVSNSLEAGKILYGQSIDVTVVNARFANPIDESGILALADQYKFIVTLEDNTIKGGFGAGVARILANNNKSLAGFVTIGWPDEIIKQGSMSQLEERHGLSPQGIADAIVKLKENAPKKKGLFR